MPTLSTSSATTGDAQVFVLRFGSESDPADPAEGMFTGDFLDRLEASLDEIESSTGPAALVTVGAGKFYSTGLDVGVILGGEGVSEYLTRVHALFARFLRLELPTVAAVSGHAFGAGAMLALCHDVRLMRSDRGFWSLPEAALGMPFPPPMHALITNRLDSAVAARAMTTAHRYGAEDAMSAHIVDGVHGPDELLDAAVAQAAALAANRSPNLRGIRVQLAADALRHLDEPVA